MREKMRRNNKPRWVQKHAESRAQKTALTGVRAFLSPPLGSSHRCEGLAMLIWRFVTPASLARAQTDDNFERNAVTGDSWHKLGHFAKRAESEEPRTKPHGATQQCLVSAAAMPQKSPPPLLLSSPRFGFVPVLGRRAPQAGVILVHALCIVLVGESFLVGYSLSYHHSQCRARQSTTSAVQRSST